MKVRQLMRGLIVTVALLGVQVGVVAMSTTPAQAASSIGGSIDRSETLSRAQYWVNQGVTYTQTGTWAWDQGSTKTYRRDCSGLVSNAWHLNGSLVTHEFKAKALANDTMHVIGVNDLRPGDAMVYDPDGPGGLGHIELFSHWKNASDHTQGAYVYSFNSTGEQAQNPYAITPDYIGNDGLWHDGHLGFNSGRA